MFGLTVGGGRHAMAIWRVRRERNLATLIYFNAATRQSFECGTVTNTPPDLLVGWLVNHSEALRFGNHWFVDGETVLCFVEKPDEVA